ncbi:twin-arginine translocase TatA/TatE family subunit [Isoptericola sp. BMS4]|uniref:twin-arginine translocase TatA/TatE family subunit n=1 Tax=Isoptericola sp. BMS4 TaxID=2527875 RepID=UPI00141EDF25|nr:twin-arginine translocase TatA/TatE family subunit [Isoptericola sp. BMS4]
MLDINGAEFVVIVVLAVMLIGPQKLPEYAAQLAKLVKRGKAMLRDAKERMDEELGDEIKDVDWSKLDPRQYDPRRIVREALLDDDEPAPRRTASRAAGATAAASAATPAPATTAPESGDPAPYDDEAT